VSADRGACVLRVRSADACAGCRTRCGSWTGWTRPASARTPVRRTRAHTSETLLAQNHAFHTRCEACTHAHILEGGMQGRCQRAIQLLDRSCCRHASVRTGWGEHTLLIMHGQCSGGVGGRRRRAGAGVSVARRRRDGVLVAARARAHPSCLSRICAGLCAPFVAATAASSGDTLPYNNLFCPFLLPSIRRRRRRRRQTRSTPRTACGWRSRRRPCRASARARPRPAPSIEPRPRPRRTDGRAPSRSGPPGTAEAGWVVVGGGETYHRSRTVSLRRAVSWCRDDCLSAGDASRVSPAQARLMSTGMRWRGMRYLYYLCRGPGGCRRLPGKQPRRRHMRSRTRAPRRPGGAGRRVCPGEGRGGEGRPSGCDG
jgi:hypothetical protein